MAINIEKGHDIVLTKGSIALSKILVGLGWDPVLVEKKGLIGTLLVDNDFADIDCDVSVIMLDKQDRFVDKSHVVYFGNLKSFDESIVHLGDSLSGEGNGDDEQIIVELPKISPNIYRLIFVVNIYQPNKRKQDFGLIKNAYIRIVNASNNREFIRFNLSDDYKGKTTLIIGEIYRHENEWRFLAMGEGTNDTSLNEVITRYR
ncbi:MAG: TerD family protein [Peptostreptococcales bacterium]